MNNLKVIALTSVFNVRLGIQTSGIREILLVESEIRKLRSGKSGILCIGIRNPTYDWNPSSTDKESGIQYLESGIHGVGETPVGGGGDNFFSLSLLSRTEKITL